MPAACFDILLSTSVPWWLSSIPVAQPKICVLAGDEHLKNPQSDSKSLTVTLVKGSRKPWKDLFLVAGAHGLE